MRAIVIGVTTFAVLFLLEALVQTLRFFGDKKEDELKRRLQSLGTTEAVKFGLLRAGRLSASPVLDALLRGIPISQRLEDLLEQARSASPSRACSPTAASRASGCSRSGCSRPAGRSCRSCCCPWAACCPSSS